jgi:hypothetical protein
MTVKQRKRMCRVKVELYSKIIKYLVVILVTYLVGLLTVPVFIVTTVWMTSGDISAYILESIYHIKHDTKSHR